MRSILILALSAVAAVAQTEITDARKKFELQKKAAIAGIEKEYLESLFKIRESYERKADAYLVQAVEKEARHFLEDKFHTELRDTVWVMEGWPETKLLFSGGFSLKAVKPDVWFEGDFKIKNLTTIVFESQSEQAVYTVEFKFEKNTAVMTKRPRNLSKTIRLNLYKKD